MKSFEELPKGLTATYIPSILDQTVGRYYVHRLFTFRLVGVSAETVESATKYLRAGLEITLARYPVLTGYLGPAKACDTGNNRKDNIVKVLFNGRARENIGSLVDDVIFVHQVVNNESQEKGHTSLPPFEGLVEAGMPADGLPPQFYCSMPTGTTKSDYHSPAATNLTKTWIPVFTLKATFLKEAKALVLGFVFQHTLVDGTTMAMVFETLIKDLKLAAAHKRDGTSILQVHPLGSHIASPSLRGYLPKSLKSCTELASASTKLASTAQISAESIAVLSPTLVFSAEAIQDLKDKINNMLHHSGELALENDLTKTDCISGLIWVASARARSDQSNSNATQPIYFRTAVNARGRLNPPLSADFFGNMFEHATTQSTVKRVLSNDTSTAGFLSIIARHALLVREAIDQVNDISMRERLLRIAQLQDVQDTASAIPAFDKANGVDFGSLATFGADLEFDIPGTTTGRAQFCRKVMPGKEGVANVLPRCGGTQGEADWEVVVSLRVVHAEKMIKELKEMDLVLRVAL